MMVRAPLVRSLRSVVTDDRGVSMLELALVLPVIMFLLLGAIDCALGIAAKLTLEQAATRTVEQAAVRGAGSNNYDYMSQEAATAANVPLANVTFDNWIECNGVRQASGTTDCPSSQTYAQYVSLKITNTFVPPYDYGGFARAFGGTPMTSLPLAGSARLRVQ